MNQGFYSETERKAEMWLLKMVLRQQIHEVGSVQLAHSLQGDISQTQIYSDLKSSFLKTLTGKQAGRGSGSNSLITSVVGWRSRHIFSL